MISTKEAIEVFEIMAHGGQFGVQQHNAWKKILGHIGKLERRVSSISESAKTVPQQPLTGSQDSPKLPSLTAVEDEMFATIVQDAPFRTIIMKTYYVIKKLGNFS